MTKYTVPGKIKNSSARTFVIHADEVGTPCLGGKSKSGEYVAGSVFSPVGDAYVAPFEYVVRAKSARQAMYFVHTDAQASDRTDELGIYWRRSEDAPTPPPLGRDRTLYHAAWYSLSYCQ